MAAAHTPYYDEICRKYPMTTLSATASGVAQGDEPGNPETGHLNIGTGRAAQTEAAKIRNAIASGEFMENAVLNGALAKAKDDGSSVHMIGLLSDGGVHSSTETLFALLRLSNQYGLSDVNIHAILDGVDVPTRTADIYVEALEIKLADIGTGRIATMCGRFFAMDSSEKWERTARYFTMLVHAEGEPAQDAVTAVRNSFLRGISDEFIAPIVVESEPGIPAARVKNGDLVIFFNHQADAMRQLARSLCLPEGASGAKPVVETVCLTEYDRSFNLPAAFRPDPETNTLTSILAAHQIPIFKITESARLAHLTQFFDGGTDLSAEQHVMVTGASANGGYAQPESQSFKIADTVRHSVESSPHGLFVVNIPAADLMAETGDLGRTIAAIQFVDTCIGGICDKVREYGGAVLITSSHGNYEAMIHAEGGESNTLSTINPVPFHYVDDLGPGVRLQDGRSLQDIAPTILGILDIEKPDEMTGSDLRLI